MVTVLSLIAGPKEHPPLVRGTVNTIPSDGLVRVEIEGLGLLACEVLVDAVAALSIGDRVLVMTPALDGPGVVLGRIGLHEQPGTRPHLALEAAESLTLRCGEASLELRADGRALLKGEDVLLRAKGTQRIRAGHVAIN